MKVDERWNQLEWIGMIPHWMNVAEIAEFISWIGSNW